MPAKLHAHLRRRIVHHAGAERRHVGPRRAGGLCAKAPGVRGARVRVVRRGGRRVRRGVGVVVGAGGAVDAGHRRGLVHVHVGHDACGRVGARRRRVGVRAARLGGRGVRPRPRLRSAGVGGALLRGVAGDRRRAARRADARVRLALLGRGALCGGRRCVGVLRRGRRGAGLGGVVRRRGVRCAVVRGEVGAHGRLGHLEAWVRRDRVLQRRRGPRRAGRSRGRVHGLAGDAGARR